MSYKAIYCIKMNWPLQSCFTVMEY